MSVVDYSQVINTHQAEVINAAGLLLLSKYWQLHILSIIDNEGIHFHLASETDLCPIFSWNLAKWDMKSFKWTYISLFFFV
jgi:hypothetical protein